MTELVDITVKVHKVSNGKTYTAEIDGKKESATAYNDDAVSISIKSVSSGRHYLKAGEGHWPAHGKDVDVGSAIYSFDIYM